MTAFSKSFTRRRYEDMARRRARGDKGLPNCLKDCDQLSADCCDNEATYFYQFLLLKTEQQDSPGRPAGAGNWAQLPWANRLVDNPAAHKRFANKIRTLTSGLNRNLADVPTAGENDTAKETTNRAPVRRSREGLSKEPVAGPPVYMRDPRGGNTLKAFQAGPAGTLSPVDMVDITPVIQSVIGIRSTLGLDQGNSLATAGALWAVGIEYEQIWECRGYRRGRLVRSLPLTAGEQMEIVTKTWDRQTVKKTLLESVERNISTEVTSDQKWTQATKNTFANQTNAGVSPSAGVNAGLGLPIESVKASGGGNLGVTGNLSTSLAQAMETSTEYVQNAMMKAANSLKSVRTNSVETVQEIGTEVTSKQVIANTNRCHSLTYHYFEVLEDFEVTTQPVGANIFLLLPLPVPSITLDWVLCHEWAIRQALPSDIFYAGLDAAKLLKTQEIRTQTFINTPCPGTQSAGTSPGGSDASRTDGELNDLVNTVFETYGRLRNAKILVAPNNPLGDIGRALGPVVGAMGKLADKLRDAPGAGAAKTQEALNDGKSHLDDALDKAGDAWTAATSQAPDLPSFSAPGAPSFRHFSMPGLGTTEGGTGSWMYWKVVDIVAPELRDALSVLADGWPEVMNSNSSSGPMSPPRQALTQFFGRLGNLDVLFAKIDGAIAIAVAGFAIGMNPLYGPVVVAALVGVALTLEAAGIYDAVPDDEGLKGELLALKSKLDAAQMVQMSAGAPSADATATDPSDPCASRYCADPCSLAEATAEWDRLSCHLNEQLLYYAQTAWAQWRDVQILDLAQSLGIPDGAIQYRFSGFHGNRGAVRVTDLDWLKTQGGFDWDGELQKALDKMEPPAEPDLITLPTRGMVVEPALGKCDGCEPFIAEHRKLDLEFRRAEVDAQKAQALQAGYEAERFRKRLAEDKLGDPTPFEGAAVKVELTDPSD